MYQLFRNSDGKIDAVNRISDGVSVPFWDSSHPLTKELKEWELLNPINWNDMPSREVESIITPQSQSANIRNSVSNEPQIVTGRSPLIINGLLEQGSFNRLSPTIWNPITSKIYPIKEGQDYLARVTIAATSDAPTVITIDLDVNGLIIFKKSFQPTSWDRDLNVETIPFFSSANMVTYGAALNIAASVPTKITNPSIYLKLL